MESSNTMLNCTNCDQHNLVYPGDATPLAARAPQLAEQNLLIFHRKYVITQQIIVLSPYTNLKRRWQNGPVTYDSVK